MTSFLRVWLPFVLGLLLLTCGPARPTLRLHTLPNYQATAPHQLLFLDLTIRRSAPGQPERVDLTNAIVGQGQAKELGRDVHTPYRLRFRRTFANGQPAETDSLEHPLFRLLELVNADGTLSRQPVSDSLGTVSVRFPYTPALTGLTLYSITPDRGTQLIYTLRLKP